MHQLSSRFSWQEMDRLWSDRSSLLPLLPPAFLSQFPQLKSHPQLLPSPAAARRRTASASGLTGAPSSITSASLVSGVPSLAALLETFPVEGDRNWPGAPVGCRGRQAAQMDRGSGVSGGGGMPPPHQQMPDAVGLAAAADPQFVMLRNSSREKIFEYIGKMQPAAVWKRWLPKLARRLEEVLFRKFPNKREYYNMTLGPIEPHMQFAIRLLHAQNLQEQENQEMSRHIASSPMYGMVILTTPAMTQGASEDSGMSDVTHHMGPSSSGAGMVPQNANEAEAPDGHVNTLLSLGINSTHHFSRVSSNNPMITMAPLAHVKEVPKEPKFSCPVCMNELIDASSTICGHIFCQKCIRASIQAQSKCPTCRRTLSLSGFHHVYLPTMD